MAEADRPMVLRLYVAGGAVRSQQARRVTEALVADLDPGTCVLEVIDVLADPAAADADRVLATPMLLRAHPTPRIRLIGGLRDPELVRSSLQLPEPPS